MSRALWEELSTICDALRVRPIQVNLAADELAFAQRVVNRVASAKGVDTMHMKEY